MDSDANFVFKGNLYGVRRMDNIIQKDINDIHWP